jgi:hypothetical protein
VPDSAEAVDTVKMSESDHGKDAEVAPPVPSAHGAAALGADDDAIIPKGALDPVYEAKARVLNHAVSLVPVQERAGCN